MTMSALVRGLAIAAIVLGATRVDAQFREQPRPEVRGVIKSIDAGTITVTAGEGREAATDKTFSIAKDVEVGTAAAVVGRAAVRAASLSDLSPGLTVSLSVANDQKTVDAIVAEGPLVRGVLKHVDAGKLTIATQTSRESSDEKTYAIAVDA